MARMFRPARRWPASAPKIVEETWLDRSFESRYKDVLDEIGGFEAVCSSFHYSKGALVDIESEPKLDSVDHADFSELSSPPPERTPESLKRWYRNDFAMFAWTALGLIEKEYDEMMGVIGQSTLMPGYDTGVWHPRRIQMTSEIHKCLFCLKVRIASIQLGLQMHSRARPVRALAYVIYRRGVQGALKLVEDLDALRAVIFHGIVGADVPDATIVHPHDDPFYRDFPRG